MPDNDADKDEAVTHLITANENKFSIICEQEDQKGDNDYKSPDTETGRNPTPQRISRSMDAYLEDAYQQDSSTPLAYCYRKQRKYWAIMLSLGIANSSDASEILCLSYMISDKTFIDNILMNSEWRGGMLAAAVFLGMLLGGLIVGSLGDFKGRKKCLLFGLILNMTAGLLSACAPNVFVLTLLRMVAGVGIGSSVPPLFTLVAELSPPSQRGFFVTLCASFWMVGSVFVALVAILFLKHDNDPGEGSQKGTTFLKTLMPARWRQFAFACALPSALGSVLVHYLVPESPRFLALRGKYEEATHSVNILVASLNFLGPLLETWEIEDKFGEASRSSANYHPARSSHDGDFNSESSLSITLQWIRIALADFWISTNKLYKPDVQSTTLPLQMVWFSLSFGSYGLMTWINTLFFAVHLEDVYFNALLFALANLPGNLLTGYLMDRIGRAKLLVGSILSASMSLLSFALFASATTNETAPPNTYGIVLSACSFQCFTIAAWNTIDVMTSELFPTTVRSTGMGVCAASGRIGAMVAQFVNGALVDRPVRLLVVAAVTLGMGSLTPFLLPRHGDMTGLALAEDFRRPSGDESDGSYCDAGEELEDLSVAKSESDIAVHQQASDGPNSGDPNPAGLSRRVHSPVHDQKSYQTMPIR
mgnify:CR=1 FL=1